ncbi:MAG TPA: ATP-binding cassette domain-containing protein [Thermodesulfovibrionales bacterium]|nr:ATP-binding cassette domain-containing protein [Thermodesulfovibrionales bacterium]
MNNTIIQVDHLVKRYGPVTAVDDISLAVEEGTIFGFLGPNGAGKTTTINILCTLLKPSSGTAAIAGHNCVTEPSEVRKSIGIVFQDTTLDKDLTAYENLLFHAYLYNVPKREMKGRIEETLFFVDLYDRRNDLVRKFSGGMKRRLEVARGLIHRPRVLFLDEPTLGLDPQSRSNLWEFITELPKQHKVTIFMTTHYMEEAEVCDRIAIIDHGKIISSGTPDQLKKIIGGDVVSLTTTDNVAARQEMRSLLNLEADEQGGELYLTCNRGETCVPELIRSLGDKVLSVRIQRPTLNDVFLQLTGRTIRDEESTSADSVRESIRAYRRRK